MLFSMHLFPTTCYAIITFFSFLRFSSHYAILLFSLIKHSRPLIVYTWTEFRTSGLVAIYRA